MSIGNKISIFGFVFVFISLFLGQMWVSERILTEYVREKEKIALEDFENEFDELNNVIKSGLGILGNLAGNPSFNQSLSDSEESGSLESYDDLAKTLQGVAGRNPLFMQIRIIDPSGQEKVRVSRKDPWGPAQIMDASKSANKSSYPYFYETISKDENNFYISDINLNRENGRIEVPHTPVIRLATPLISEDKKMGVLVINVFMGPVLRGLSEASFQNATTNYYLLNSKGHFLLHPNKSVPFAFDLVGSKYGLFDAFPSFIKATGGELKSIPTDDYIVVGDVDHLILRRAEIGLPSLGASLPVFQVSRSNFSKIFDAVQEMRIRNYVIGFVVSFLVSFLFVCIIQYFFRPQKRLLEELRSLRNLGSEKRLEEDGPQDISQIAVSVNRLLQRVEDQKEELKKAEKEKGEAQEQASARRVFLSRMSHEIRTPLNGIIGFTYLLHKECENNREIPPKVLEHIGQIKGASGLLLNLVNNVLDLSKFESGGMGVSLEDADLRETISSVIETAKGTATEKGVLLVSELSPKLEPFYKMDHSKIIQVVTNLVGNAVRFTSSGKKVTVRVTPARAGVEIEVEDEGIGISESQQEFIFEPFRQGDETVQGKFGGTGLGLSIVKHIVDQFGGEVSLDSQEGVGTKVSVYIPMKKSLRAPQIQEKIEDMMIAAGQKALLVEDNAVNQTIVKEIMEGFGLDSLAIAPDGCVGLEKVKAENFDLILMDYHMPGISGIETTLEMKTYWDEKGIEHTPIILLTADVTAETKEAGFKAGIDGYATKPIDPEKLFTAVSPFLELKTKAVKKDRKDAPFKPMSARSLERCRSLLKEIREVPSHLVFEAVEKLDVIRKTISGHKFESMQLIGQLEKSLVKDEKDAVNMILTQLEEYLDGYEQAKEEE